MKRPAQAALVVLQILCVSIGTLVAQIANPKAKSDRSTLEEKLLKQRTFGNKPIPKNTYDKGKQQWQALPRALPLNRSAAPAAPLTLNVSGPVSGVSGTSWVPIGPMPLLLNGGYVNGRVHAIAIHPFNPNVIYAGMNIGGLWRTTDAGAHWEPLYDQQVALGVGQPSAVAIDPNDTNTIYVGTNARFQLSKGILKSTDGGASWIVLGSGFPEGNNGNTLTTFGGNNVDAIIVDPANSNNLYLASNLGLYYSTDGGNNWTQGTNGGGAGFLTALTLELDPTSPAGNRILFAGVNGSGIRRSNDGGKSWTQVLSTATPAVAAVLAGGGIGKVAIALAPPTSPANSNGIQVIYATFEGTGSAPDPLGIFESTDQGGTWTQRAATGLGTCQCNFTMQLGVDPASPGDGANDQLYWGGTNTVKSTDSGATFSDITNGMHADVRANFAFVKQSAPPSIVYSGNDGGIYRSTDGGGHWTGTGKPGAPDTINAGGLQTGMLYHMDLKRDASAGVTIGAFQDNGSAQTTPNITYPLLWTTRTGGDGFDVAFETATPANAYEMHNVSGSTDGVFFSNNSGDSFSQQSATGIPNSELGAFSNSINVDPSNTGTVYVSGSATSLFQSTDNGSNFKNIKNFGAGVGPVDVAPANGNYVAAAIGAQVWVSTNALGSTPTFTNITRNLPSRAVTQVAFDPNDPTVVYATLSGVNGGGAQNGHIFRTTIGGTQWADLSPALDVPFNGIAIDGAAVPSGLYVGTDLGVIRSVDGGATWAVLDDVHFPNNPVTDIKLAPQAGVLRASTFGRGVFQLAAPTGPVIAVAAQNGLAFGSQCPGSVTTLTIQVFNVGTTDLTINSVSRLMGSSSFAVQSSPATPIVISPNAEVDFTVQFTATSNNEQAIIRIASNDPNAPFFDLTASGSGGTAVINATFVNSGVFANTCRGDLSDLNLQIVNQGACSLSVSSISSSNPNFVIGSVSYPLVLSHDASVLVPVRFQPVPAQACSDTTPRTGTVTIASNDPVTPSLVENVSGMVPCPHLNSTVANSGSFTMTCLGNQNDLDLQLLNQGKCSLTISSISSSNSANFVLPAGTTFPLVLSHDANTSIPIRFKPDLSQACSDTVPRTGTITVNSDDPAGPFNQGVSGLVACPKVTFDPANLDGLFAFPATVADPTKALGCYADKQINVRNDGACSLVINSASAVSSSFFNVIAPTVFPITLAPGLSQPLTVRFKPLVITGSPTAPDSTTGTLTITTNAPTSPNSANLCGEEVQKSGERVLVTDSSGAPILGVDTITLTSKGIVPGVNLKFNNVFPVSTSVCGNPVQFHIDQETLAPTQTSGSNPKSSYETKAKEGSLQQSVSMSLGQCDFKQFVIQLK